MTTECKRKRIRRCSGCGHEIKDDESRGYIYQTRTHICHDCFTGEPKSPQTEAEKAYIAVMELRGTKYRKPKRFKDSPVVRV